jgi:alkaline phosphatase D
LDDRTCFIPLIDRDDHRTNAFNPKTAVLIQSTLRSGVFPPIIMSIPAAAPFRFLRLSRMAAGLLLLPWLSFGQSSFTDFKVTHGPIVGRPGPHSMSIWLRTNIPGAVSVKYGKALLVQDQVSAPVTTLLAHDNTGVVTLDGLEPDTRYYYTAGNGRSGSFRTMPDPEAYRHPEFNPEGLYNFRFQYSSCANQNARGSIGPSLPMFDVLNTQVRDNVLFAIFNGDWIYEEDRDYPADSWRGQVRIEESEMPEIVSLVPPIVGVWENYKTYLDRGANLAAWHRNMPSYFTFDDHEILNDIFGAGEIGYVDRRAVFRDTGVQAWNDYLAWANPKAHTAAARFGRASFAAGSDVLFDPEADFSTLNLADHGTLHVHWGKPTDGVVSAELDASPGNPNAGVYGVEEVIDRHRLRIRPAARADGAGTYSMGRRNYGAFTVGNCEFILVDTRSHRTLHDTGHPDNPGSSMLGQQQFAWLKQTISDSKADFVFIVSSVGFMIPHVGSGGGADKNQAVAKDDAWTVFLAEREELLNYCDSRKQQRFFLLTGDLHNSFAIRVTDNVWEFAAGPVNSVNHAPQNDEGGRPPNGVFTYGPRPVEIRWSTYVMPDIPRLERIYPTYCVVQVNNVFNNPVQRGGTRWIAYPHPQVIFNYHDGLTGDLLYSESIVAGLSN